MLLLFREMQYIFDIMLDRSYSYGKERVDSRKGNKDVYKRQPEEIKAGINDLDFGPFGIIDWYAHRQGYQDQDDAAKVALSLIHI